MTAIGSFYGIRIYTGHMAKRTPISIVMTREMADKDMTLRDLELASGVSYGTLKCIKSGRTGNPGVYTMNDIAEGLGYTLGELMELCREYDKPEDNKHYK